MGLPCVSLATPVYTQASEPLTASAAKRRGSRGVATAAPPPLAHNTLYALAGGSSTSLTSSLSLQGLPIGDASVAVALLGISDARTGGSGDSSGGWAANGFGGIAEGSDNDVDRSDDDIVEENGLRSPPPPPPPPPSRSLLPPRPPAASAPASLVSNGPSSASPNHATSDPVHSAVHEAPTALADALGLPSLATPPAAVQLHLQLTFGRGVSPAARAAFQRNLLRVLLLQAETLDTCRAAYTKPPPKN